MEDWGNISQQELANPATHYSMSVELVEFMSQLLNLVLVIQIFTHVKFAANKHS